MQETALFKVKQYRTNLLKYLYHIEILTDIYCIHYTYILDTN